MSANAWKWVLILGLGGLIAMGEVFTDPTFPGWWDLIRHFGGGVITAAIALKTTLAAKP